MGAATPKSCAADFASSVGGTVAAVTSVDSVGTAGCSAGTSASAPETGAGAVSIVVVATWSGAVAVSVEAAGVCSVAGAGAAAGFGGLGTGFLAVSKTPSANSITWPSWISQCKSLLNAVTSGEVSLTGEGAGGVAAVDPGSDVVPSVFSGAGAGASASKS